MPKASAEPILVRFSGDLTTKGKATRRHFVHQLQRNLRDALQGEDVDAELVRTHDRLLVEVSRGEPEETLSRVFGVQSLSRATRRPYTELADVVEAGLALFRDAVKDKSFAVRARRVGNRQLLPVRSHDVEIELGRALLEHARCVDLEAPELRVAIEMMPGEAYFYAETRPGFGGLPVGVEGRALALVSGGFDSAVAAWQLLKRGVALDYVFCNLGGRTHQLGTLRVMKVIADRWSYGTKPRFHAIDFEGVTRNLQEQTHPRYWQVILKRLMLRAAEQVARERRAVALVTGDAVGQVSSQTLPNLAVISEATRMPILRPLVGHNKDEILEIARRIGTFELSKVVGEYCALVPRKPATQARSEVLASEESQLDPTLLERAVEERSVFDLRALDLAKLELPELEIREVPEAAVVLDLRSRAAYGVWHYPEALYLDFAHALAAYPSFDRQKTYVLYCEFGLKSAHLAERMRADGFEAYHFRGGLRDLLGHARERGIETPGID